MSNCFRMDLKRSIFCKKFCAVVLGVLIVLIISTWDDLKMYTRWGDVPGYSGPVDTLAKSLAFDKFKIVVVFCWVDFIREVIAVICKVDIFGLFLQEQQLHHIH